MKLVKLPTQKIIVNEEIVAHLENALANALEGDYSTIAIVTIKEDGTLTTCYSSNERDFALIGGLECLKKRILNSYDC